MATTSPIYRAFIAAAVPLVPRILRDPRQLAAHAARLAAPARIEAWAKTHRDRARPLAWFHAPSVGEGLQAQAVINAFRTRRPDAMLIYTHYSPSAETFAGTIAADWSGYLPYDRAADMQRVLGALEPDVLVFTKLDLWPELAVRAAARGTQVAMVAATVSTASGRLRWPSRSFTAPGYHALDAAGAISAEDAERLAYLGCRRERIVVTGDPRIDSALARVDALPADDPLGIVADPHTTLVAGSTWPADEAVILEAFRSVRSQHHQARLIVVPHDPTTRRLAHVEALAARHGLPAPVRLAAASASVAAPILLVDRVGVLAQLYASGSMAYVGGGWGTAGIHSVLEPAAWGRPVVIGPHDRDSRDARLLANAGALTRLPGEHAAAALATLWSGWLDHPAECERAGRAARSALEQERGAAERSAQLVIRLLEETV